MIGFTKLLCGTATVSDALKYGGVTPSEVPPELLQFTTGSRPITVWNITKRCNLKCKHCYIGAEDKSFKGELTTEEALALIEDLGEMRTPVLLFSGGEPTIRKDFFELGSKASDLKIRAVVSTNGTLITPEVAEKMLASGFKYVGVSIDGLPEVHNAFRGVHNAFERSINGIKNAMGAGLKTGVRFTVSRFNYQDLPGVIDRVVDLGVPRFCMYHLVYAGRGKDIAGQDLTNEQNRELVEFLIEKTLELHDNGVEIEVLTTDNHADGVYLRNYIEEHDPERADEIMQLLKMHGGCSAGHKTSNVDPFGNVHPCQFWSHLTLGNVRERRFSEIWNDPDNDFLKQMRTKPSYLKGKCSRCSFNNVCGGCRIRAETLYGDIWAEDPACYLSEGEIMRT
ncbi:MAG: radical SAM protein [Candidatus Hydrothermarchaeales archaeon]